MSCVEFSISGFQVFFTWALKIRSYLKKVFFPNLCVRPSFQVLDILEYACGLKLGPALTLSQNPIFEMASKQLSK